MRDIGLGYPFKTRTLKLKETGIINYVDEGAGDKTVLFIHGLANYAMGWKKNIEALKDQYRCIALDLPGNGLSECGDYPYSIQYFSGVVESFIKELKLQNVVLVGHSMGAQVVIATVLRNSAVAQKLVLCAPAGFEQFTPMETGIYQATLNFFDIFSSEENSLKKTIQTSFYHHNGQGDEMIRDLVKLMHKQPVREYRKMVEACIHGMLHEPVFNSLHLVQQPALVIFGDRDALIPNRMIHPTTTRKIAEEGAAQMPHAELHIVEKAGHFVQWEKAKEVNELIREFIK